MLLLNYNKLSKVLERLMPKCIVGNKFSQSSAVIGRIGQRSIMLVVENIQPDDGYIKKRYSPTATTRCVVKERKPKTKKNGK